MKLSLLFSAVALLLLSFSCEKKWCKDKEDVDTYYSEDYETTNLEFFQIPADELTELYFHFYYEGKDQRFKFVGERNGETFHHEGNYIKNNTQVNFYPENTMTGDYEGVFSTDGETLTISFPDLENRVDVTFIYKGK